MTEADFSQYGTSLQGRTYTSQYTDEYIKMREALYDLLQIL